MTVTAAKMQRLHLGCGQVYFENWLNVDLDSPRADMHLDLSQPLPLPGRSAVRIFNEHFLEHLDLASGMALLRECRRILKPGGVLRVAMPDLDTLLSKFHGDWRDQDWLRWPGHEFIESRVQMLNIAMRAWGHEYLYNREELELRLRQCGFDRIEFPRNGESRHDDLRGRETRPDSVLIAEASYG